jgi:hypothetical protein
MKKKEDIYVKRHVNGVLKDVKIFRYVINTNKKLGYCVSWCGNPTRVYWQDERWNLDSYIREIKAYTFDEIFGEYQ